MKSPHTLQTKFKAINICDSKHNQLRKKLVEHGRNAAHWIQNYFVQSTNEVVTSPDSLFGLFETGERVLAFDIVTNNTLYYITTCGGVHLNLLLWLPENDNILELPGCNRHFLNC